MFLTCCSPKSSKAKSSLSRTWSRTTRLMQIPPGSAKRFEPRGDIDAVAVDVVLVDEDVAEIDADAKLDRRSWAMPSLRIAISRCSSIAHRTASTTLANSTSSRRRWS